MKSEKNRRKRKALCMKWAVLALAFGMGMLCGVLAQRLVLRRKTADSGLPVVSIQKAPEIDRSRVYGTIPVNPYITENFIKEDLFMTYRDENGVKISHPGIDVSSFQKEIDWQAVRGAGAEFVFIRAGYRGYTEGGIKEDEMFAQHMEGALAAGLSAGVYFFSQAVSEEEAVEEAQFVLELIKDYPISYPVVYDTEFISDPGARTRSEAISRQDRSRMCIAFAEAVKSAGYYPMIYCNENWIRRYLDYGMLEDYDFWVPQYNERMDFMYDFTIWQYTESGEVPGIDAAVDINISLIDYASFISGDGKQAASREEE